MRNSLRCLCELGVVAAEQGSLTSREAVSIVGRLGGSLLIVDQVITWAHLSQQRSEFEGKIDALNKKLDGTKTELEGKIALVDAHVMATNIKMDSLDCKFADLMQSLADVKGMLQGLSPKTR